MSFNVMSARLKQCLTAEPKRTFLSPYLTAGFPSKQLTVSLMHEMVKAGADIIELGIPFSEPMAEGVTIQYAMEVALDNHTTVDDVFNMVTEFRQSDSSTAIILMGYMNPVEAYGLSAFAQQAKKVGVDGTIIVDLPPEEGQSLMTIWRSNGLDPILLCSPTTSPERMSLIAEEASGYVYYVSLKGVTGSKAINVNQVAEQYHNRKQALSGLPLFVGFGIKTPEDASNLGQFSDGIVIGAALIETIKSSDEPLVACYNFLFSIKQALGKQAP